MLTELERLIDAYTFHRDHWHLLLEDAREAPDEEEERIREDMEEALIHVTNDRDYTAEALKWAKTAWEETDQSEWRPPSTSPHDGALGEGLLDRTASSLKSHDLEPHEYVITNGRLCSDILAEEGA